MHVYSVSVLTDGQARRFVHDCISFILFDYCLFDRVVSNGHWEFTLKWLMESYTSNDRVYAVALECFRISTTAAKILATLYVTHSSSLFCSLEDSGVGEAESLLIRGEISSGQLKSTWLVDSMCIMSDLHVFSEYGILVYLPDKTADGKTLKLANI